MNMLRIDESLYVRAGSVVEMFGFATDGNLGSAAERLHHAYHGRGFDLSLKEVADILASFEDKGNGVIVILSSGPVFEATFPDDHGLMPGISISAFMQHLAAEIGGRIPDGNIC